jgi:hypothetical protein
MKQLTELSSSSSITEIKRQLSEYEVVQVWYEAFDPNYFDTLVEQLPDYRVWHLYWSKRIQIEKALSTMEILSKQGEIYQCAKAYKQQGIELMERMSEKFGLNLETLQGLFELKFKKSERQRGKLDEEWDYWFHGAECRFDNSQTGQIVEIILAPKSVMGFLDGYFWLEYMQSTDRFKYLADWFENDHRNVWKAIDTLERVGVFKRNPNYMDRNIYAE